MIDSEKSARLARPFFSVVIPVRNEAATIKKCLDSVCGQDYKDNYEILIIDGVSEDTTATIVAEYSARDERVKLWSNPKRITPAALNIGIAQANGEIIVRIDGHWTIPSNFLTCVKELFAKNNIDCLGGRIVRKACSSKGQAIEKARATLLGGGLAMRTKQNAEEKLIYESNVAFIWRRQVWEIVNGFDERFVKNQDNEFNLRTFLHGFRTLYSPQISFDYFVPESFKKLYQQIFGYTFYMPIMMIKHPKRISLKGLLPVLGWIFLVGLIVGVIPLLFLWVALIFYGLLLIGTAAFKASTKEDVLYMSTAFLVIHGAIILGFTCGSISLLRKFFKNQGIF